MTTALQLYCVKWLLALYNVLNFYEDGGSYPVRQSVVKVRDDDPHWRLAGLFGEWSKRWTVSPQALVISSHKNLLLGILLPENPQNRRRRRHRGSDQRIDERARRGRFQNIKW